MVKKRWWSFRKLRSLSALETLNLKVLEGTILPHTKITFPHIFVDDKAYSVTTYIMKPNRRRTLDRSKTLSRNYRPSRAGRFEEWAFGICALKWSVLEKALDTKVDIGVEIVKCIA
jgi:hypothetical protein